MVSLLTAFTPAAFTLAAASDSSGLIILVCEIAFVVIVVASMWIVFTKAGEPGWAAIIPFYNFIVLCRIGGKPWWWLLLLFIPFVNLIVSIMLSIAVARKFGRGTGFGVGLSLLAFIFYPILAFGDDQYDPAG